MFLEESLYCYKVHLRITFAASHRLCRVEFPFSFVCRCFLMFSLIYSLIFFGSSMFSVHICSFTNFLSVFDFLFHAFVVGINSWYNFYPLK